MRGAIWAQSRDGVIGDGSSMPWHLPEDLRHFKELTVGCPVIMGRRTWQSLDPRFRPLPGRSNFVLTRREPGQWSAGARVVGTLDAVASLPDAWFIGGGAVYRDCLPLVDTVEVTVVGADLAGAYGDAAVTAPALPPEFTLTASTPWLRSQRGRLTAGEREPSEAPLQYRFLTYSRGNADSLRDAVSTEQPSEKGTPR